MNDQQQYQHDATTGQPPKPAKPGKNIWKYILTIFVTALVTFMLTAGGFVLVYIGLEQQGLIGKDAANSLSFAEDEDTVAAVEKLKDVLRIINDNYYEELTDAQILEAMASGVAGRIGSRYTMYLTAEQNARMEEGMSGEYVGIGALVMMNRNGLVEITEVLQGSPAEAAGIRIGDVFIEVDGTNVSTMDTVEEVAVLVRGEAGTYVELVMFRSTEGRNLTFDVERQRITNAALNSRMLTDEIGYIQIREFSGGVSELFADAIDDLQARGAKSIVFDLQIGRAHV